MKSCIYEGRVSHQRFSPKPHSFHYKLYMLYIDLSELGRVFRGRWIWSAHRPGLAWLRRQDHMGPDTETLETSVRNFVDQRSGVRPTGPIRLLTQLRHLGYLMNPVSFYFCYGDNEVLQNVVAEVNNTPWGEQHCYLLDRNHFASPGGHLPTSVKKEFHVSPFLPMDMRYQWNISLVDGLLNLGITNFADEQRMLSVSMQMNRREITTRNLNRMLFRHPLMTTQIVTRIYWQAFRLWWKNIPVFSHPQAGQKAAVQSHSLSDCSEESI